MSLDGIFLRAVVTELQSLLVNGRVDRVYQPDEQTVLLHLYAGRSLRLLFSVHPQLARLGLVRKAPANPPEPPAFCMLLRKHLEGARIESVEQAELDRIATLHLSRPDELGRLRRYQLQAELMGRRSNLLLLDADGRILDALHRAPGSVNKYREVLPGRPYVPPPSQDKLSLFSLSAAALAEAWSEARGAAWKRLLSCVDGLGPQSAREVLHRAGLEPDAPGSAFGAPDLARVIDQLKPLSKHVAQGLFRPTLVREGDRILAFGAFPLTHLEREGRLETYDSANQLLDAAFAEMAQQTVLEARRNQLEQSLRVHLERSRRKLSAQQEEWEESEEADGWRRLGELLTANLHAVRAGAPEIRVVDYYDPAQGEVSIPLDPSLTPAANAQAYFKRYNKAKRRREALQQYLEETRSEVRYLEEVGRSVEQAEAPEDLDAIAEELAGEGYLRQKRRDRSKNRQPAPSTPHEFRSSDGFILYVGKNNRQNDELTMRKARPGDLWLHVKDAPGSHVILRSAEASAGLQASPDHILPARALEEACSLAAYYSKARHSSNVPVDYTWRKHVWKPRGARPGFVLYEEHQTRYVTPDPALVERLRVISPD